MGFFRRSLNRLISGEGKRDRYNCLPDGDSTQSPLPRTRLRALSSSNELQCQQLQCLFFKLLSAELGNRIYELVLSDGGGYEESREPH